MQWNDLQLNERPSALREYLHDQREKIMAGKANGVNPERYTELLVQACGKNQQLLGCTLASLCVTLSESANLGLEISNINGYGYAVPRKRRSGDNFIWEAQFQAGYLGKLLLAHQCPNVSHVTAEEVFEGDEYQVDLGTGQEVHHQPVGGTAADIVAFYAVVFFKDGGRRVAWLSRDQVEHHMRQWSHGYKSERSAWCTSFGAMGMKTVLLRALKLVPLENPLARTVLQREEYDLAGLDEEGVPNGSDATLEDLDGDLEKLAETQA